MLKTETCNKKNLPVNRKYIDHLRQTIDIMCETVGNHLLTTKDEDLMEAKRIIVSDEGIQMIISIKPNKLNKHANS